MRDDLDGFAQDTGEEGGFGTSSVHGPGSTGCSGQTDVALRTDTVALQECGVALGRRNERGSRWTLYLANGELLAFVLRGRDTGDGQHRHGRQQPVADSASGSSGPKLLVAIDIHFFSFLTQVVQLHFPSSFHLKFADRLVVRCEMSAAFVRQKHVRGATIPERSKKSRLAHNEKQEYFLRRRVVKRISRKCARV